jgi:hypothetical protein
MGELPGCSLEHRSWKEEAGNLEGRKLTLLLNQAGYYGSLGKWFADNFHEPNKEALKLVLCEMKLVRLSTKWFCITAKYSSCKQEWKKYL